MDLVAYWSENPPVHLMVRAYLGIGKDSKPKRIEECTYNEKADFFAALSTLNG